VRDTTQAASVCVLFMAHEWNGEIAGRFSQVAAGVGLERTLVLFDTAKGGPRAPEQDGANVFRFDSRRFAEGEYPTFGPRMVPGHTHFPLLWYYAQRPEFDYYWAVEYDVVFTGPWRSFFETFSRYSHDFVSCHIRPHAEEADWYWWNSFGHPTESIVRQRCLRSFNPIVRLSARALAHVHAMHLGGWWGHHEVLLPTLLAQGGFSLLDVGGDGPFVPKELRNRHYTSFSSPYGGLYTLGTMRYRPVRAKPGRREGRLYHPVKPQGADEPAGWPAAMSGLKHLGAQGRCQLSRLRHAIRRAFA